jgi:hypothetical protein
MRHMARVTINTISPEMCGNSVLGTPGNSAWPGANDAMFLPLVLTRPIVVKRLYCMNGNVAGNNVDVGIYTWDGARIVSSGSTAQSGTTAPQFFDIADTYLSPGQYYLALAANGTTATFRRVTITVIRAQHMGVYRMGTAFALPAVATFASPTSALLPIIGVDLGGML